MNLLEMALQHTDKPQWHAGETIWLIPDRVFLKHARGDIHLCLIGYQASCLIMWLDQYTAMWTQPKDLQHRYATWAEHAKIWYDMKNGRKK